MRRASATTWVCTGCNAVLTLDEGARPVEVEMMPEGSVPIRIIAVDGTEVHRCSPSVA